MSRPEKGVKCLENRRKEVSSKEEDCNIQVHKQSKDDFRSLNQNKREAVWESQVEYYS